MKDFHEKMIEKQGALDTVDKTIQELTELIEQLRNWKIVYINKPATPKFLLVKIIDHIQEECVDSMVMIKRIIKLFGFKKTENDFIETSKINRTIERYLL